MKGWKGGDYEPLMGWYRLLENYNDYLVMMLLSEHKKSVESIDK